MGKPKKKGRANKKKRGGGAGGPPNSRGANAGEVNGVFRGDVPSFTFGESEGGRGRPIRTLYSSYKRATDRFLRYMLNNVPENLRCDNVSFILTAADWMAENEHKLPQWVLSDLKLSIRMRSRVARSVYGGGDDGHKHFIEVLVYCWSILQTLPKTESAFAPSQEEEDVSQEENKFSAFESELEDEDDVEDEELFPTKPVPRPEMNTNEPVTFEDLMKSDDRNDAFLFLEVLDQLMGSISHQCTVLAKDVLSSRRAGYPESNMVEKLLEVGASSSMAIQKVQQLEMELQAQHNHLKTPFHVMSVLVLPHLTAEISKIVEAHASARCPREGIISFLGDSIECSCRNESDRKNRKDTLVTDFCSRYHIDGRGQEKIDQFYLAVTTMCLLELPIKLEKATTDPLRSQMAAAGGQSKAHSWLSNFEWIGQDRSILHTIRLLQLFGGVVAKTPPNRKVQAKRGSFGKSPWVAGRATKIQFDMDELLMSDVLPSWLVMCRQGIVGKAKLPIEAELCPLFVSLRSFFENPEHPVSWGLSFGLHAMLTGVLEIGAELDSVSSVSKSSFRHFFKQVEGANAKSKNEEGLKVCPAWKHNVGILLFLDNYNIDAFEERAIWNPISAGTILNIGTYFGNLDAGCALIDCRSQLRIVLFMYHGHLIRGLIRRGQIPLLDEIYDTFKDCKAIWTGSLPKRGELVYKFWLSQGMDPQEAKAMSEKARCTVKGTTRTIGVGDGDATLTRGRRMVLIDPAEISTSYRRICCRDFADVVDKYHTSEQKMRTKGTDIYEYAVRTNDTLDAIESEQVLLSFNLTSVGYILEQYVCSITRVMQWEPLLKGQPDLDMRQGFFCLFARELLGRLDFSVDPQDRSVDFPAYPVMIGFADEFFGRVPVSSIQWWQASSPTQESQVIIQNL